MVPDKVSEKEFVEVDVAAMKAMAAAAPDQMVHANALIAVLDAYVEQMGGVYQTKDGTTKIRAAGKPMPLNNIDHYLLAAILVELRGLRKAIQDERRTR